MNDKLRMINPARLLDDERGLTITEVLLGMSLAAVAAAVIFSVFLSTQNAYYDSRDMSASQSELRIVSGMIASELRSAGSDARDVGFDGIITAFPGAIQFSSDLNGDGIIDSVNEPAEQVTYVWDDVNEELLRATGAGTFTLMTGVVNFACHYFTAAGVELLPVPLDDANRAQVRRIRLDFTVTGEDGVDRDWSTNVSLRNDSTS
jgi:hypothetical protein